MTRIALVDCNSFYCSCERAFNPKIEGKPVIVLSNNDGCAIALTEEAKQYVPMGAPIFEYMDIVKKHNIHLYSSNYTLYADMSRRVYEVLSQFSPNVENYSIDESFVSLEGFGSRDLTEYGKEMRATVLKWTGIPTSVGIGSTKTLAKIANKLSKKNKMCRSVLDLTNHPRLDDFLASVEVGDVWGVGRRYAKLLKAHGINTALDLRNAPDGFIRKHMTVKGLRTVWELRGTPCIELNEISPDKKEIINSRAFGKDVSDYKELSEAIASYATRAAEKLRSQNSICGLISVWIQTNLFKPDKPQYSNSISCKLPEPTAFTPMLIKYALHLLKRIYRDGYEYKKAGVVLMDIVPATETQLNLFAKFDYSRHESLMMAMDNINGKWGRETLRSGASGYMRSWGMKRGLLSPNYTTSWNDLLCVKAR